MKRGLLILINGTLGLFFLMIVAFFVVFELMMREKNNDPFILYWENYFHNPHNTFLSSHLSNIKNKGNETNTHPVALVLAADIGEKDTLLLLENGYDVIAVESRLIYYELLIPHNLRKKATIIGPLFKEKDIPPLELVVTHCILPFYRPKDFNHVFAILTQKLKSGGLFIATFLAPDCTLFPLSKSSLMSLHTRKDLDDLFKDYDILNIKESNTPSPVLDGNKHSYQVLARKK